VGVVSGLGAIVFYQALKLGTFIFLKELWSYSIPTPAGEGNNSGSSSFIHPFLIPLIVGLGRLISGLIVFSFAPEAESYGTDAAIHHNPRSIAVRTVIVKIIASAKQLVVAALVVERNQRPRSLLALDP
ncbi:unnamed protein product, partial [Acidithrix sp. C25]